MDNKHLARRNFIVKLGALACTAGAIWLPVSGFAVTPSKLTGARLAGSANQLKFSLVLDNAAKYKVFTLSDPDRVVIDLMNTSLVGNLKQGDHNRPPLKGIRYAEREDAMRVVLDMTQPVEFEATLSKQSGEHVLDIIVTPKGGKTTAAVAGASAAVAARPAEATPAAPNKPVTAVPSRGGRPFTVIIDPGHGGRDPGAMGRGGTMEKDIVLSVARKLKANIDRLPNIQAVLTRDSDVLIPLRRRLEIAHERRGDLFISIHADASNNARLDGSSVYILSQDGASSEAARLLAESENSYDVKFGGVSMSDTNERIASVLLDLSQRNTINQSLGIAKGILNELAQVSSPLKPRVESAGFMVLKSPDIPSVLVETAFISNPYEERRLRTPAYQQQLADALTRGVRSYKMALDEKAPEPTTEAVELAANASPNPF